MRGAAAMVLRTRRLLQNACSVETVVDEEKKKAGMEFRRLLLGAYACGDMPATLCCRIAHHSSASGAQGVCDLTVRGCHANRCLENLLAKEFPPPQYTSRRQCSTNSKAEE